MGILNQLSIMLDDFRIRPRERYLRERQLQTLELRQHRAGKLNKKDYARLRDLQKKLGR